MSKRILLLKPFSPSLINGKIAKLPLELLSLASALCSKKFYCLLEKNYGGIPYKINDFEISIQDLSSIKSDSLIREKLLNLGYFDLVGITSTTSQIKKAIHICTLLKNEYPETKFVIGGAHASLTKTELLKYNLFDVINIGEGVESFPLVVHDILNGSSPYRAHNIIYDGYTSYKDAPDSNISMDDYPLPSISLSLIDLKLYDTSGFIAHKGEKNTPIALIQTSVGCNHRCSFCSIHKIYNYRKFMNLELIYQEFLNYYNSGIKLFHIVDDTFSEPFQRPLELANILEKNFQNRMIEWVFNIRADNSVRKYLDGLKGNNFNNLVKYFIALSKSGCIGVSIGIESGDEILLNKINKYIDLTCVALLTQAAIKAGLGVKWYLMVGLPGQTWSSIYKTVNLIKINPPTGLAVSFFIPHIGTKLFGDKRIQFNSNNFDDYVSCPEPKDRYSKNLNSIIKTDAMTDKEITEARNILINSFLDK